MIYLRPLGHHKVVCGASVKCCIGSIAPRAGPRTLFDRNRPFHTLLSMIVYRTIDLVFPGFEGHFEFGTLASVQAFGLFFDPFALDLQSVSNAAGVFGLKHIGSGFVQGDLGRVQLVLGLLHFDGLDNRTRGGRRSLLGTGRLASLLPTTSLPSAGPTTG